MVNDDKGHGPSSKTEIVLSGPTEVKIKTFGDIEAAGIDAFDRVDLSARNDLTLLAGSILSGLDGDRARFIYLRAGEEIILDGTLYAHILVVYD